MGVGAYFSTALAGDDHERRAHHALVEQVALLQDLHTVFGSASDSSGADSLVAVRVEFLARPDSTSLMLDLSKTVSSCLRVSCTPLLMLSVVAFSAAARPRGCP